jgi:single-strand DNA-binding protein
MAGVNKVILVGNLGADPELRYTAAGDAVCELRLATSESWKDKDGNQQERVEWHRVVVWGKRGAAAAQFLRKGRAAYVEGRIRTRSYEDKEGTKRYITEVIADEVTFLDGGKRDGKRGEQRSEQRDEGWQ